MAEAFIEKVSGTVEKESHQVRDNVSDAVGNVTESVEGVADKGKEEAKGNVAETKKSIASLVSHGLTKVGELVHASKDYVDHKGTDLQRKIGQVSDSSASMVKTVPGVSAEKSSEEVDSLPVSEGSSSSPAAASADRGLPENEKRRISGRS